MRQAAHIRMEVTVGDPSEAILQTGRRLKAGLIVMGTHGLGGFRKLLLGSTTEQVLRRTEWPVLAVPAGAVSAPAVEHPGVQLKRILVATDFRESAMAAMQWAGDLASDISVPLVLAHVVEPVVVPPRWQALVADFEGDRIASGQRMLARLAASFRDTHTDCVVSLGRPADTIASLAVEYGAGLVVMGLANPEDSEPRKPGSIAYRVLRLAHVALVVVPRSAGSRARPDQPRHASSIARAFRRKVARRGWAINTACPNIDAGRARVSAGDRLTGIREPRPCSGACCSLNAMPGM